MVLPERSEPRERWITRSEAARLIWAAYRYREVQKGHATGRRSRRHVARFVLVALYTGTRAGAICSAAFEAGPGQGFLDLERGVFFRRRGGAKVTKKRQPPVRLPDRLLAHFRRWRRRPEPPIAAEPGRKISERFAVEFNGKPIGHINKAFRATVKAAKLSPDVIPHCLRHTAATWGDAERRRRQRAGRLSRNDGRGARTRLRPPPSRFSGRRGGQRVGPDAKKIGKQIGSGEGCFLSD